MSGISINDMRKNLRDLNEHMDRECLSSAARYGMVLDASLITGIDPPPEVESALAAINTAYNQVSSDISLAQASADQKIVQSKRAVEIETLKAQAEVEPLNSLAAQLLAARRRAGQGALAGVRAQRPAGALRAGDTGLCGGEGMIDGLLAAVGDVRRAVHPRAGFFWAGPPVRAVRHRAREALPRVRVVRQECWRRSTSLGCTSLSQARVAGVYRQLAGHAVTCSTCGWTRSTCAASRSIPRRARRWGSASGTRCSSAIRSRFCSRTPIRAGRWRPT